MVMKKKQVHHKTSSNKPKCQNNHKKVLKNNHGGFYMNGVAFSESKWLDIINCIEEGTLDNGDILVVDNSTIHFHGENESIQDVLWNEHNILLVPLPPYHPELNPTELVFRTILVTLKSIRCQIGNIDILKEVNDTLSDISYRSIKSFYKECGYLK